MLKTVAFWESFMSVLLSLTGTFYLRFASLFLQTSLPWVSRCCSVSLSTDAAKSAARADSAPPLLVRGIYTPTLNMTHNKQPVLESLTLCPSHSSDWRDKASSVLHHILEQRQWRSGKFESKLTDLFLQQSPALFQAPAGQQHQRSGCHLLSRTAGDS